MDKLIVASMRQNAGKTGLITGLAKVLNRKFGYMKPIGDRLLYRKKQLWDHDAALICNVFGLTDDPLDMSLGFDHAKLRFMYDADSSREKLLEAVENIGADKELLLIEGGRDISYGISVHLDSLSLARYTGGKLLLLVSGDEDAILDEVTFAKKHLDLSQVDFGGLIVNKLQDVENFKTVSLPAITEMGLEVLGMMPHAEELTRFSVGYLADRLFAKVISGARGLTREVQTVLVGAMSTQAVLRHPDLSLKNCLMITGGDRTDMILAALESQAVAVILTNDIVPPANIISQASDRQIPLLLVTGDTYQVARQIDNLEPLLTQDDREKIDLWAELVREHVDVEKIVG